jgi:type I restriction enzyme S subunit
MSAAFEQLGAIAKFINGAAFEPEDWGDSGARIIRIQNLTDPRKPFNRTTRSVPEQLHVHPGDLLVSWSATLGVFEWTGPDVAVLNQHIFRVVPDERKVHKHYLHHGLELALLDMQRHLHGATMQHVNRREFLSTRLYLPSLAEQRRIAQMLDRAEALRAKRRAALGQLDTLTQAIFLDMFGDPATNPKGWPRRSISEVGDVITGNTPPRAIPEYYGGDIEWIKSDNINTPHYYLTRADEGLSALGKQVARTVPAGSILVTCIAGTPECIGNAAMTDREVAFNQQINALVPHSSDSHFVYVQLLVGKRLVQRASTSSMKGMVSKSRFERIMLMCPPLPLQRQFAQRSVAVEKLKAAHHASLAEMDGLFASLQHRAFRGEL